MTVLDRAARTPAPPAGAPIPPRPDSAAQANVLADAHAEAEADFEAFRADHLRRLEWATPFLQTLDWTDPPLAKWSVGGTLNVARNRLGLVHHGRHPRRSRLRSVGGLT